MLRKAWQWFWEYLFLKKNVFAEFDESLRRYKWRGLLTPERQRERAEERDRNIAEHLAKWGQ